MNMTTALGLVVSAITGAGVILATIYTGKDKNSGILKDVYEQRLALKDEIIAHKDEEIKELKIVSGWYEERIKQKDTVIKGLFKHELQAMDQAKALMEKGAEDDSAS